MRRMKTFAVVSGIVGATLAMATPAVADDKDKLVDRIVAKADPSAMQVLVTTRDKHGVPTFSTIKVPDVAAAKRVVRDRLGRKGVVAVEMDQVRRATVNDPFYRYQWALNPAHFDINTLYRVTRNDTRRPIVAVVDSGVWAGHPDLTGRVSSGYSVLSGGAGTSDGCGHGTHVAGVIAAKTNNGTGVAGMSRTATILPIKVFDSSCQGLVSSVATGIVKAVGRGAHVISLSLQGDTFVQAEADAVAYARSKNRIVVAAAGNHNSESCGLLSPPSCFPNEKVYPAGYAGVIGVAAADQNWQIASFSNTHDAVDVSAPGVGVLSTMPSSSAEGCGSNYCFLDGTSMATPHVSALAAMALAHCSNWWAKTTSRDNIIIDRIQRRASHYPSKDESSGYGHIKPKSVLSCT